MAKRKVMHETDVLEAIKQGETAYDLLLEANPVLERRWERMTAQMTGFLTSVREYFPDAQYYTAGGGFHLLLGRSHDDNNQSQSQLEALDGDGVTIGDGDY